MFYSGFSSNNLSTKSLGGFYNLASDVNPIAVAHFNRVIADGGTIDSFTNLNAFINDLERIYGTNDLSSVLSAAIDPSIFGYRIGASATSCSKLYSLFAASDVEQTTAANQPLLLRWNRNEGNYLYAQSGSAGSGNNITSSNNLNIQGDIDVISECNRSDYQSELLASLGGKATVGLDGFSLRSVFDGSFVQLDFAVIISGVSTTYRTNSTLDINLFNNKKVFYRAFYDETNSLISFYWGYSLDNFNFIESQPITVNLPNNSGTGFIVGVNTAQRKFYSVKVYQGVYTNNNILVSFEADDYDINLSQNTILSSETGETWTFNYPAITTTYKIQLVYRTTTQSDAINDSISSLVNESFTNSTLYMAEQQNSWTSSARLIRFNNGTGIRQITSSPNIESVSGLSVQYLGELLNRLQILTSFTDGATSTTNLIDNSNLNSGASNTPNQFPFTLFSGAGVQFSNIFLNTFLFSKQQDDLTIRTNVYNLIRQYNGLT